MKVRSFGRFAPVLLAACLALGLACLVVTLVQAAGAIVGPLSTPPGGVSVTVSDPTGRQIGLTSGITYTMQNFNPTQYDTLYWGIALTDAVSFSYDGMVDLPSETLHLSSGTWSHSQGRAYWWGRSPITYWDLGSWQWITENDEIFMHLTVTDMAGNPIPLVLASEVGITGPGVVMTVTQSFRYNLVMMTRTCAWCTQVPSLEYFNNLHTLPSMDSRVLSNVQPAFYYTDKPIMGLSASNDSPTGYDSPTNLVGSASAGTNVLYSWDFGDGQSTSGPVTAHVYPAPGFYTATLTAFNAASVISDTTSVTITESAITGLSAANDGPTLLGNTTTFTASHAGGGNVIYTWDLGDGTLLTGKSVTHTYSDALYYTATVTAANSVNQPTASTQATVIVSSFAVEATSPLSNTNQAPLDAPITVTFDSRLDPATLDSAAFRVSGSLTGRYAGSFVTPAADQAVFTHSDVFKPGERVQVSLTSAIQHLTGTSLTPYAWYFRSAVPGGSAVFQPSQQPLSSLDAYDAELGDLDGDGDLDAIVFNYSQPGQVWLNDGSGALNDSGQALPSSTTPHAALGDLDGDGDLDAFLVSNSGTNQVYLNDGQATFTAGDEILLVDSYAVKLGDLDSDGDLDVFLATYAGKPDRVYFNNGYAQFSDSGQSLGLDWSVGMALADVDNDGDLDAYTANCHTTADQLWLNDGSGLFTNSGQILDGLCSYDADFGDLNGDGDLDLVVANSAAGGQPMVVYWNDGHGAFTNSGQILGPAITNTALELGDLDADGDLDLFSTSDALGQRAWLNDGTGVFTDTGQVLGSSQARGLSLGDLDLDGDLDAYVAVYSASDEVWLNQNASDLEITRLSPAYKFTGDPSFTLNVTGAGFQPDDVVKWGQQPLATTFISPTLITAQVPSAGLGSVSTLYVRVMAADYTASTGVAFTVHPLAEWFNIGTPSSNLLSLAADPTNPDVLYAGDDSGHVFKSVDAGSNWDEMSSGLAAQMVFSLAVHPTNSNIVYAALNGGGIYKSIDGGESWTAANNGLPSLSARAVVIDPLTPTTLYAAVYASGVYKSTNSGESWSLAGSQPALDVVALAIDPVDPDNLYAGIWDTGQFMKSTDGGSTWTSIPMYNFYCLAVNPLDPDTLLAGTVAGAFLSLDGGANWTQVYNDLFYSVAFDPVDANVLYLGGRDGRLLRSPDLGVSWKQYAAGLDPSKTLNALIPYPPIPDILYTATIGGIYTMKQPPASFLTSLYPAAQAVGGPDFTLNLYGGNFYPGAVVYWNTTSLETIYISATQVSAQVPGTLLDAVGSVDITLTYPYPGSEVTNGLLFTIRSAYPIPVIDSLVPTSTLAGSAPFILQLDGSGYTPETVVKWNGLPLATVYGSATQIQAALPASRLALAGEFNVTAVNPIPIGGPSNAVPFIVYNPLPVLAELDPSSAIVGSQAVTLTVSGSGFVDSSVVRWEGGNLITTYISASLLEAVLPASALDTTGTFSITVFSPAPGGGLAQTLPFTVYNPQPALVSLNPSGAIIGSPTITLTLTGSGFVNDSVVHWDGVPLATIFISAAELQAIVPAADLETAGSASLTVVTPAPGGGNSNALTFMVSNPMPVLASISPSSIMVNSPGFTLTVNGTGFVDGSKAYWSGVELPTIFVSSTQLNAAVPAANLTLPGPVSITVVNPSPGGGRSNVLTFNVNRWYLFLPVVIRSLFQALTTNY